MGKLSDWLLDCGIWWASRCDRFAASFCCSVDLEISVCVDLLNDCSNTSLLETFFFFLWYTRQQLMMAIYVRMSSTPVTNVLTKTANSG